MILLATLFLLASFSSASTGPGGACSTLKDRLDPLSHKFVSQCSPQTFCSAPENGTCTPRLCRRDEFPFGYSENDIIPPLCPTGTFCSDQGDGCKPLTPVGGPCQLNRDEQCQAPFNWLDLSSTQNFNGAICLHSVCMFANVTYGMPCIMENTTYVDMDYDSQQASYTVFRDNCRPQLYCDQMTMACQWTKRLGSTCLSDQECDSRTCANWTCVEPPETPLRVTAWQCVLITLAILGAMTATCLMLTILHKRHRFQRYRELCDYYHEQLTLRTTLMALHSSVADRHLDVKLR